LSERNEDLMHVDSESEAESEIEMDKDATKNIESSLNQAKRSLPPKKLKIKAFLSSKNTENKKKLEITEVFEAPGLGSIKTSKKVKYFFTVL